MTYPYDDETPYEDETEDRVIARALDADETDEAAMDRATLDEYRNVLASLPFEEIEPPAALEDRTIDAALARRPAEIPSINRRAKRRATARWVTLGAAVTAAAAVIAFMFVTGDDAKNTPGGKVDLAGSGVEDVTTPVLTTPGVRKAPLIGDGHTVGQAALTPAGDGVLYDLMPANELPPGQRLWLWLVTDGKVVPIGPLPDPSADTVHFIVSGDVNAVTGVSISLEDGGATPTTPAAGSVVASATF
jgi:anti-sigma-K factor RskA